MSYLLPHLHTGYAVDRAIMEVSYSTALYVACTACSFAPGTHADKEMLCCWSHTRFVSRRYAGHQYLDVHT